ncbi:MAG: MDR family MFS transporter [Bacillota bacterium]|nr:MDR family MFS transporter [Bacillota bacterium]
MEHMAHKQKIVVIIAVMSAMLFAALNQTIVGTALPRIIASLGGMEYFSWVFTIYMLASSITAILVGKLSDIYGRKPFILSGLTIFIIGSLLAGLSQDIIHLILSRGIQGLGGGMIMSTSFAAIGDLFSPRERARWQGLMGAAFGIASVLGPTLGGYIVDNADWHWIFWVFLPFGVIALLLITWLFPTVERRKGETIDYYGSILLTAFMVPLLLAFTWGGSRYTWGSIEILILLGGAMLALTAFLLVEGRVKSPVLPLHLFRSRSFTVANVVGFLSGIGMFGAVMYTPFFVQGVLGASATTSGFAVMPMLLTMVTTSAITGQIVSRTGKYRKLAIMGLAVMTGGITSMALMNKDTAVINVGINMMVIGIGLGISFPIFSLTAQNAVDNKYLGVATATSQLFRQFGGTIGVALLSIVMNQRLAIHLNKLFSQTIVDDLWQQEPQMAESFAALQNPQILMNHEEIARIQAALPAHLEGTLEAMINILREALNYSLSGVFAVGAILVFMGLVITFFLEELPLRTTNRDMPKAKDVK